MGQLGRREFLAAASKTAALAGGAATLLATPDLAGFLGQRCAAAAATLSLDTLARRAPRARYWVSSASPDTPCATCHHPQPSDALVHDPAIVRCLLCANACIITPGKRGTCKARMNVDGELRSLVYGRPMAVHVDPIEKKPFYHFRPGARAYSVATSGCPLRCSFCQNWQLSRARPEDYRARFQPPEELAAAAQSRDAPVIAFTYNEPTVFTEYLTDVARAARDRGIRSVLISCGYMQEAPLDDMCDVLAAIKIDLKGINPVFYRDVCQADLSAVLRSIRQVARRGVHLELVNLVVPTLNDSDRDLRELAKWVAGELGPDVPVHFTRFHPDFKLLNLPPTPISTLERARDMALDAGLRYPFVGNVPGHAGNHTHCPQCERVVIERRGFFVVSNHVKAGRCAFCKTSIAGVWD